MVRVIASNQRTLQRPALAGRFLLVTINLTDEIKTAIFFSAASRSWHPRR